MSVDYIRYDLLTQEAMRGVVRTVLKDTAARGELTGDHHFFITFDTRSPGVKLSPRMRAQYPQDMTIVLQHQFWDLTLTDDVLEVGLSFGGIPERLAVPLAAIKSFVDPSVKFGMQFAEVPEQTEEGEHPAEAPQAEKTEIPAIGAAAKSEAAEATAETPPKQTAEVVRFDRFRKK
jgi:hypothetical protein